LTEEDLRELQCQLEADRVSLERRVTALNDAGPVELDQSAVGRVSRMDALMNQGLAQGSDARALRDLGMVLDALARTEGGTYGWCQTCGTPIPRERLTVLPEARECGSCSR
jgi:DnaK suppressor protein